jgi:hypothetical protein
LVKVQYNASLPNLKGPRPGKNLSRRQAAVLNRQPSTARIAAILMRFEESVDFGVDRRLQHPPRPFLDDRIERTTSVRSANRIFLFGC